MLVPAVCLILGFEGCSGGLETSDDLVAPLCGSGVWANSAETPLVPAAPQLSGTNDTIAIRYPTSETQSPINQYVASRIRDIAATAPSRNPNAFIKVGDSITVNPKSLGCISEPLPYGIEEDTYRNSGGHAVAEVITHYCATIDGTSTFERNSLAARVAVGSTWVMEEDPTTGTGTRLQQEIMAANPQVAIVMFGTNDMSAGGTSEPEGHEWKFSKFPGDLLAVVDGLIDEGVVPIVMSVPPRITNSGYVMLGPTYNTIIRAVAESRQVPYVDYYTQMLPLPEQGMGPDGVHPNSDPDSGACNLSGGGLQYGYNVKNLLMLTALERVRRVLVDGHTHLDSPSAPALALTGSGTVDSPFAATGLPFATVADIKQATESGLTDYSACATTGAGPEHIYQFVISAPTKLRAFIGHHRESSITFHLNLMANAADGASCIGSHRSLIDRTLDAGTYYFSVEADAVVGEVGSGEYMFGIQACDALDPACD